MHAFREQSRGATAGERRAGPMKVMTVVGTRPEVIRLSRVIAELDRRVSHVLVHTGQNHDYELNEIFFRELRIRRPDHQLACAGAERRGDHSQRDHPRRPRAGAREAGRAARARGHQQLPGGDPGQAPPGAGVPHGSGQPLLRRARAGGDQPPHRRPHERHQPPLFRARPPPPAARGAAAGNHHQDRLAHEGGARLLPARHRALARARAPRAAAAAAISS